MKVSTSRRDCCLHSSRRSVTRKENTSSCRKGKCQLAARAASPPPLTFAALSTPYPKLCQCRCCQVSGEESPGPLTAAMTRPSCKATCPTHHMCHAPAASGPVSPSPCASSSCREREIRCVSLHALPSLKYHLSSAFDSNHEVTGKSAKQQVHPWSLQMPYYKYRSVFICSDRLTECEAAGFHAYTYIFSGGAIHRARVSHFLL